MAFPFPAITARFNFPSSHSPRFFSPSVQSRRDWRRPLRRREPENHSAVKGQNSWLNLWSLLSVLPSRRVSSRFRACVRVCISPALNRHRQNFLKIRDYSQSKVSFHTPADQVSTEMKVTCFCLATLLCLLRS